MQDKTTEFSFILKPADHGVGVFATHNIKQETYLRLFGDDHNTENQIRRLRKTDVSQEFQEYCISRENEIICPKDFGCMPVGWYLNHSHNPNAIHRDYHYYSLRDIFEGQEITIDYNTLEEPEDTKENYYK
jgi:SET domain-containing protein